MPYLDCCSNSTSGRSSVCGDGCSLLCTECDRPTSHCRQAQEEGHDEAYTLTTYRQRQEDAQPPWVRQNLPFANASIHYNPYGPAPQPPQQDPIAGIMGFYQSMQDALPRLHASGSSSDAAPMVEDAYGQEENFWTILSSSSSGEGEGSGGSDGLTSSYNTTHSVRAGRSHRAPGAQPNFTGFWRQRHL